MFINIIINKFISFEILPHEIIWSIFPLLSLMYLISHFDWDSLWKSSRWCRPVSTVTLCFVLKNLRKSAWPFFQKYIWGPQTLRRGEGASMEATSKPCYEYMIWSELLPFCSFNVNIRMRLQQQNNRSVLARPLFHIHIIHRMNVEWAFGLCILNWSNSIKSICRADIFDC